MDQNNNDSVEIIDFEKKQPSSNDIPQQPTLVQQVLPQQGVPSSQQNQVSTQTPQPINNQNVILDNSVVNPEVFQGLSESNVENGIETFNQAENILNESIKSNFGTDEQIQKFNSVTSILEEDKKNLEQNAIETANWVKQSMKRNENATNFNAAINPTINNISSSVNFEKPTEINPSAQENEREVDVVDNTSKNKKGIAFIVILFILLFAFVFALPYITNISK